MYFFHLIFLLLDLLVDLVHFVAGGVVIGGHLVWSGLVYDLGDGWCVVACCAFTPLIASWYIVHTAVMYICSKMAAIATGVAISSFSRRKDGIVWYEGKGIAEGLEMSSWRQGTGALVRNRGSILPYEDSSCKQLLQDGGLDISCRHHIVERSSISRDGGW